MHRASPTTEFRLRRQVPADVRHASCTGGRSRSRAWGEGEIRRLKQLEEENAKLKRLVADLSLDKTMLQDVLGRKF